MYRLRGLGVLRTAPPTIATALQNASNSYGVPLPLLQAVAQQESAYNPNAVSSAGAQGLMQIMPANDASLGITNPFDPQQSANAGAQFLAQLYKQYGDWNTALIAYNEGPGNLASKGPFASSQSYAAAILANAGQDLTVAPDSGAGTTDTSSLSPDFTAGLPDASTGIQFVDDSGSLTGWGWGAIAAAFGLLVLVEMG